MLLRCASPIWGTGGGLEVCLFWLSSFALGGAADEGISQRFGALCPMKLLTVLYNSPSMAVCVVSSFYVLRSCVWYICDISSAVTLLQQKKGFRESVKGKAIKKFYFLR